MSNLLRLSASSIAMFKACPYRYYLHHVLKLRPIEETDSQRIGTNWHTCLELATAKVNEPCLCFARSLPQLANPSCAICQGTGSINQEPLARVSTWLHQQYATVPASKTTDEWVVERETLANAIAGWLWLYQNDGLETLEREQHFSLSVRFDPDVQLVGKIDRLVKWNNRTLISEAKSTGKSIDSDSNYWDHLLLDTQINMYLLAGRRFNPPVDGVLYDVFRRPSIRLKQKETPDEYGKRLLQDITDRPTFYFARREIARLDQQLDRFNNELEQLARSIQNMMRDKTWFHCEGQCEATWHCPFLKICYHNVAVEDGSIPDGFTKTTT